MELVTGQSIYYSNKHHLPLEDVAESLLALKSLIEATPDVLERLSPGLHIQKVQVFVNEIKSGSLWEDLVVRFLWGNQEKLGEEVDRLRKEFNVDSLVSNRALVGAIIGALIMGGGLYVLNKLHGSEDQKQTLQNTQNVFIINGASLAGVTPEEFKAAIDAVVRGKENLPKDAVKVVRPAKREPHTSILLNRGEPAPNAIPAPAVEAMPRNIPEEDRVESLEDFLGVEIELRAIDLDSMKRGWAAVVPSVDARRTKMHLDALLNPAELIGKTKVVGDITVLFKHDESGNRYPALVFLRKLRR